MFPLEDHAPATPLRSFGVLPAALLIAASAVALAGCAARSRTFPPLQLEELAPDRAGPQAAGTTIRWTARVSGGAGDVEYAFHVEGGDDDSPAQAGPSASWDWTPGKAGTYRVKVVVRDATGASVPSPWSDPYTIVPALTALAPVPSRDPPLRARAADVYWNVEASGGVAPLGYEFHLERDGIDRIEQTGASPTWAWLPRRRGVYRVKTVVRDAIGNSADGGWSKPFPVEPAVSRELPIAVLPPEDLTERGAPLAELRASLLSALRREGLRPLDETTLDGFLDRHRVRHVGGVPAELSRAFGEETGAEAVLVTTVERYVAQDPPRLTVVCRLTTTGEKNSVLWMDSAAAAGNESPGFLDLGRVHDVGVLRDRASARLAESLAAYIASEESGTGTYPRRGGRLGTARGRKFRPTGFYSFPDFSLAGPGVPRIAVLPFDNDSSRTEAGRVLMLQFVESLANRREVDVLEPGDVRQALLQSRLILEEGPSISQADLLHALLGVDLVVAGNVAAYDEPLGEEAEPVVAFSVQGISPERRQVVWTSLGNGRGGDGVVFFDIGRVYTAHAMAAGLVDRIVIDMLSAGGALGR